MEATDLSGMRVKKIFLMTIMLLFFSFLSIDYNPLIAIQFFFIFMVLLSTYFIFSTVSKIIKIHSIQKNKNKNSKLIISLLLSLILISYAVHVFDAFKNLNFIANLQNISIVSVFSLLSSIIQS